MPIGCCSVATARKPAPPSQACGLGGGTERFPVSSGHLCLACRGPGITGPRRRSFASRLPSPRQMAPAQRCPLCRQTFFCGRGHVYSRKHQRQLKVALERLLPQVRTGGWRGLWTAWGGAAGAAVKARGLGSADPAGVLLSLSALASSPSQVEAARKAVRAAQVERYVPEHERWCWCLCCGCEVRKHLSHGNLTVLHGGLLEHLAR